MAMIVDPCLTPDQHRLRDLISDMSETCWSAGWLEETEFDVWRLATEGGTWGRCSAAEIDAQLAEVITLSKELGVWVVWSGRPGCDNEPVPLSDWQVRYNAWKPTAGPFMTASVKYPMARWSVMEAVAALSDPEYQQRIWIRQELPHENYYDPLDQSIHTLFDDWVVLPDPQPAIGAFLVDGPEIECLRALGEVLDPLISELKDRPDADYISHPHWPLVIERARAALSAMVLAGSIERSDR